MKKGRTPKGPAGVRLETAAFLSRRPRAALRPPVLAIGWAFAYAKALSAASSETVSSTAVSDWAASCAFGARMLK